MKINLESIDEWVEVIDEWVEHEPDLAAKHLEERFELFASYFFWVKSGRKKRLKWWSHLKQIAEKLIAVKEGLITFLIINMPPRYGKTELAIKLFGAWSFALNPASENIHLSHNEALALDNSDSVRQIVKLPEFQKLWPECATKNHKDGKGAWATVGGGIYKAAPAGTGVLGFGAGNQDEFDNEVFNFSGYISVDDPLKADDAHYDNKREAVNRKWDEGIKTRRNSRATPVVVIMQRIHEIDFCGMLLEDGEFEFERLILSAIVNEGAEDERPLCEEKHTLAELHAMREKNKWHFAGQYQQDPAPLGGGMIRAEWWPYYESLEEVTGLCNFFFITADTAYTSDNSNDPTVLQFWGCEGSKRLYLLDQMRGWWEFPELLVNSAAFLKKHPCRTFYVEAKASGKSLVQTLRKNDVRAAKEWNPKHFNYPIDKVGRVQEMSYPVSNGDIWIPDESIAPWVVGFVDEHSKFSDNDTHLNDDQVDTATMAYSVWRKKRRMQ